MNTLSYILIVVAALIAGMVVFLVMKFIPRKTPPPCGEASELEKLTKQHENDLVELESKLASAVKSKTALESELSVAKEKLQQVQEQLTKSLENQLDKDDIAKLTDTKSLKEQIEKLEKKVKDAEDELEDAEDDIDKLQKDLKRKKAELDEVTEQAHSEKKKNAELENEILSKTKKLDQTEKSLELKDQSLSLVQEVLQAEKASDGKELEVAVDRLADFISGEMSDVLKDTSLKVDDKLVEEWALSAKKTWLKNKTTIAFVGEFSAGKTSIVNRILSQDNPNIPLLPVSAKATTAIPTYISGGIVTAYQFYSPDNILKSISESTFKRVTKEVLDQVEGLSSLITYFVMKYQNPNLNDLSILDTPGFNSNDSEDSRRTVEVINECDALFWVFDVNAGTVNRSSLSIIKKHLRKPLYIVINKVDTKSDKEVAAVEALIKKTMEKEGINVVQYIRFSSNPKYDLVSIMTPIHNVQRDASRDLFMSNLEAQLNSLIEEKTGENNSNNKEYNNYVHGYHENNEAFFATLEEMYKLCECAVDIPQYKSGFLGFGEGYKMSTEDYNKLTKLLDCIANEECNYLVEQFGKSIDIVSNANDAYTKMEKAKQSLSKLEDTKQKYAKLVTAYKKALEGEKSK